MTPPTLSRIPREATFAADPHRPLLPQLQRVDAASHALVRPGVQQPFRGTELATASVRHPPASVPPYMDVLPWASSAPVASSTHAKSSSLPSAAKLRHVLVTYLNKQREGAAAAETARHHGFVALKLHISWGERVPSVVVNNILQQNLGSSVVACIIGKHTQGKEET
ncbi:uncharacterized protein LOC123442237 [Hordeum vulgare subsp. vulgare]|uniref:uncharacterized protein LOC123442237 n=1 Tax=Hordeum vulgare subsp. vulgare TaxID=112509 RepID=UPI001D1A399A|nr:uncharacterized protein LOC123442237 [Hordeum vulgare subsp. vulgare]